MKLFDFGHKDWLSEVRALYDAGDYRAAADAAGKIPETKLKTSSELLLVAKAYDKSGSYAQAKRFYLKANAKRVSKGTLLALIDCCLELNELEEANGYFDEYHNTAPDDEITLYIYRYKLEKKKGRDVKLLISILEELKGMEYMEEYAYELAKLYHKAGQGEKCMEECQEIILWFGEGPTVERAKALLAYYKGELSLEEIKTVGERYVEEQKAKQEQQWEQEQLEEQQEERQAEEDSQQEEVSSKGAAFGLPQIDLSCLEFPQTGGILEFPDDDTEASENDEEISDSDAGTENAATKNNITEAAGTGNTAGASKAASAATGTGSAAQTDEAKALEQPKVQELFEMPREYKSELDGINEGKLAKLFEKRGVSFEDTCGSFLRIPVVRKQIIRCLGMMSKEKGVLCLVITGESKTGKTTLAYELLKLFYQLGLIGYKRTAVIEAKGLNEMPEEKRKKDIKSSNLIIGHAGSIQSEVLEELLETMQENKNPNCVILEDGSRNINKLLREEDELGNRFSNRIHLPKYSVDDLMGFAYDHIIAEDYAIEKTAAELLRGNIGQIMRAMPEEKHLASVIWRIKQVLKHAEEKNKQAILNMAAVGKFTKSNLLVLTMEDFE